MQCVFVIITKLIASEHYFCKEVFCNNFGRDGMFVKSLCNKLGGDTQDVLPPKSQSIANGRVWICASGWWKINM